MYAKAINLLCASNKVFVKYQVQGRGFNPKAPLRTTLDLYDTFNWYSDRFYSLKKAETSYVNTTYKSN